MAEKYVQLNHVEELLRLMKNRDAYHPWSKTYAKLNDKLSDDTDRLKESAIVVAG